MRLFAARGGSAPFFRQIETMGDGQARGMIADRERHRDLAIVLLAEPAAILACDADRMGPLFRYAAVVHDPGVDRAALPFN